MNHLLKFLILPAFSCLLFFSCRHNITKPNVVIVITDDQGYGDMSCHGNPYIQTPAIDKLHSESVVFENFHVDPVCAPSRAALMTGKYSARVGVYMTYMGRHHLSAEEVTMADVFSENGYKTGIFGKWHLGDSYPFRPSDRGFDESLVHGGGVISETPDYWGNDYYDDIYFRNNQPEQQSGYCTDVWFEQAKQFVKQNKDNPFFLYLATNAPHGPLRVPYEYVKPFLGKPGISEERAWFYGMIASIDQNLAGLRKFLEQEKLAENTVFIFMTDNGTRHGYSMESEAGYNAGMRGTKATPWEGGHRVPLMVHWPAAGFDKHKKVNALTAHFDVLPTLIDMLGLNWTEALDFDGISMKSLIESDDSKFPARTLMVQNQVSFGKKLENDLPVKYKKFAVMTDQWRLVGSELFDIQKDPGQELDISERKPEVVAELMKAYDQWWAGLEPTFDRYNSVIVGDEEQPVVELSSQFWHGDHVPYNQRHVRAGMKANGFWDIDVVKAGNYQIALRRWPEQLSIGMDSAPENVQVDTMRLYTGDKSNQIKTKAIDVQAARLKVGSFDEVKAVEAGQEEVLFDVQLKEGKHFLKSWLIDSNEDSVGAYYVYMRPKK